MIEVIGLSKRFGDVQVLTDINAKFFPGQGEPGDRHER